MKIQISQKVDVIVHTDLCTKSSIYQFSVHELKNYARTFGTRTSESFSTTHHPHPISIISAMEFSNTKDNLKNSQFRATAMPHVRARYPSSLVKVPPRASHSSLKSSRRHNCRGQRVDGIKDPRLPAESERILQCPWGRAAEGNVQTRRAQWPVSV